MTFLKNTHNEKIVFSNMLIAGCSRSMLYWRYIPTIYLGSSVPENFKRYVKKSYNQCIASDANRVKKMYASYLPKNALVL